jgi:hypothetical protein
MGGVVLVGVIADQWLARRRARTMLPAGPTRNPQ